jgi:hypothetical protein
MMNRPRAAAKPEARQPRPWMRYQNSRILDAGCCLSAAHEEQAEGEPKPKLLLWRSEKIDDDGLTLPPRRSLKHGQGPKRPQTTFSTTTNRQPKRNRDVATAATEEMINC